MATAVCPGTFDPITNGHLDIIERTANIYDKVVVAVGRGYGKKTLFTVEEREELVSSSVQGISRVTITVFDGLLVEFARAQKADVIVKGLRAVSDFEHEFQMALLNKRLAPEIETVFLMASPEYMFLSSSGVKEIAKFGGNVHGLVPEVVEPRMSGKYAG